MLNKRPIIQSLAGFSLTPALLIWARGLVVHLGAFSDLVDKFLFLAQREADDRQVFGLPGPDGLPVGRIMASRKHILYIDRKLYAPVHGPSVDGLDFVAVGREHNDRLDQ
ncbi:MAG: hypothetical protein CM1200mP18_16480 [Gammaproteobacteria bacterium]|nr:MAG: hypothetical protein CM1200mP18_16480 [Gammaproteobacteria bacterium]